MENLHGLSGQFVDIHRPGSVVKNPRTMQEPQETRGWSLGQKDPLDEGMATHSSILSGKSHGQRSLVGYSPRGGKESDTTEPACTANESLVLFLIFYSFLNTFPI